MSVGANFSYLYGDITHQSMTAIGATDTRSIKLDKFSISDYKLDFGLQYTYKLNKKNEEITLIDHILKLLDLTSGSIILWHDRAIACSVRRYAKRTRP